MFRKPLLAPSPPPNSNHFYEKCRGRCPHRPPIKYLYTVHLVRLEHLPDRTSVLPRRERPVCRSVPKGSQPHFLHLPVILSVAKDLLSILRDPSVTSSLQHDTIVKFSRRGGFHIRPEYFSRHRTVPYLPHRIDGDCRVAALLAMTPFFVVLPVVTEDGS